MTTRVRTYSSVSLGFLIYVVIGLIVTVSQDYWNVTDWDGHALSSFLTAFVATFFWPIAIFYNFILTSR